MCYRVMFFWLPNCLLTLLMGPKSAQIRRRSHDGTQKGLYMAFACIFKTFDARSRNFPFLRTHARRKTTADKCLIAFPCRFFHRACAPAPPICKYQTVFARAPYSFAYIRIYLSAHTRALWPIWVYGCIWADKWPKGRLRAHGP
jgi:hypothetical protein